MNGEIIYYGVSDSLLCRGVSRCFRGRACEIRIDRIEVPHILHLLRIQGLPIATILSGKLRYGSNRFLDLSDWMLAKCSYPKLWQVPHYLQDVVWVKADNREQTMLACVQVHKKS